jgi:cellulose synthase/poly-beta-1,6-N-acetylglucosamine synthase-like glycosyltransferase
MPTRPSLFSAVQNLLQQVQSRLRPKLPEISWYTSTGLALTGVLGLALGRNLFGWGLLIFGTIGLVTNCLVNAWQNTKSQTIQPKGGVSTIKVGTTVFFVAGILASEIIPSEIGIPFVGRLALLVVGTQAMFVAITVRGNDIPFVERVAVPVVGHMLLAVGTIILIISAFVIPDERVFQGVLLWYATGLSALALDAFWMGQRASEMTPPPPNSVSGYWESVLLGAISLGVSSLLFIVLTSLNEPLTFQVASLGQPWTFETPLERVGATVVGVSAVLGFATLAAPESAPRLIQKFDRAAITIGLQALTTVLLFNSLLLGLFFILPISYIFVFGLLLGLVIIAVLVGYTRLIYIHRQQEKNEPPQPPDDPETPPVTVLIVAYNEADILPESIERNLETLPELSFLLVPAKSSTDGTVELAYDYQQTYPDRVTVVEGTTGSKAGDINLAWEAVDTPYVLLLDADETADSAFVQPATAILKENPEIGIVQGRKVARHPHTNLMARFVSAERRLNTWIEHQFVHDKLSASHFAGSAALIRHKAPQDVEGWSTQTLTEDIDLSLRLYLRTDWDIYYSSQLTVGNLKPATTVDLIRQRRRWARGWTEATWRYTKEIIQSRRRLGWTRTVGLLWELFTTISAPLYLVSVSVTVFVFAGLGATPPTLLAILLAVLLLPERPISFAYAAINDPTIPVPERVVRVGEILCYAYLWILLQWIIQLHVIYLQLANAPKRWQVTRKSTDTG